MGDKPMTRKSLPLPAALVLMMACGRLEAADEFELTDES